VLDGDEEQKAERAAGTQAEDVAALLVRDGAGLGVDRALISALPRLCHEE